MGDCAMMISVDLSIGLPHCNAVSIKWREFGLYFGLLCGFTAFVFVARRYEHTSNYFKQI